MLLSSLLQWPFDVYMKTLSKLVGSNNKNNTRQLTSDVLAAKALNITKKHRTTKKLERCRIFLLLEIFWTPDDCNSHKNCPHRHYRRIFAIPFGKLFLNQCKCNYWQLPTWLAICERRWRQGGRMGTENIAMQLDGIIYLLAC